MNEAIVEVLDGQVKERGGNFKGRDGEDIAYNTRKQEARLEVGGFAYPYDVRLEDGQEGYKPGRYRLALEKMLTVNKGVHALGKFTVLVPLAAAAK